LSLLCIQLIIWGHFSGNQNLIWLWCINLIILLLFFAEFIIYAITWKSLNQMRLKYHIYNFMNMYGITLLTGILLWLSLSWLLGFWNWIALIIIFILWILSVILTNWSLFKEWLYRGKIKISPKWRVFISSLIIIVLLFSFNAFSSTHFLYTIVIWIWFVFYTLWVEVVRIWTNTSKKSYKWRNSPLWILFATFFGLTIIRSLWTYWLNRVDDHTIEKIIIEERVIYVPIEDSDWEEVIKTLCNPNECLKNSWECVVVPSNSSCQPNYRQWRVCNEWREQDWNICVEVIEAESIILSDDFVTEYSSAARVSSRGVPIVNSNEKEKSLNEIEIQQTPITTQSYLKLRWVLWNNINTWNNINVPIDEPRELSPIQKAIKKNNPQSVADLLWNNKN